MIARYVQPSSILSICVVYNTVNVITFHFQFFALLRAHCSADGVGEGDGICRHIFFYLDGCCSAAHVVRCTPHSTSAVSLSVDTLGVLPRSSSTTIEQTS